MSLLSKANQRIDRLVPFGALIALAAMASLPFLHPHHLNPIPSFFGEWWAAALGLIACGILIRRQQREFFAIPQIALLPVALAVLVLLQMPLLGERVHADQSLIAVLYLLWAAALMTLAQTLRRCGELECLATALAAGIALGALLSAASGWLQLFGTLNSTGWITVKSGPDYYGHRIFGNIAQPNQFALHLWLGIAALLFLAQRGMLRWSIALAAILLLATTTALSASRASTLYVFALAAYAGLFPLPQQASRWRSVLTVLAAGATLFAAAAFLPGLLNGNTVQTLNERSVVETGSDGIRLGLWWMAAQMGLEAPWLGIGWGRFSATSFASIDTFSQTVPAGLTLVPGEHAHNVFFNLLAELGFAAPILLLGFVVVWGVGIRRQLRQGAPASLGLFVSLLLLIAVHAQLEYTLWYSFFLGIAALALGAADARAYTPALPRQRPLMVGAVLCAAIAVLLMLRVDYARMEAAMHWPMAEDPDQPRPRATVIDELVRLGHESRYASYVDLALTGALKVDDTQVRNKLLLCERAIRFSPAYYAAYKCSALQALAGDRELAMRTLHRAMLAHPAHIEGFVQSVVALEKASAASPESSRPSESSVAERLAPLRSAAEQFRARQSG
jgi:O-antigen ligase